MGPRKFLDMLLEETKMKDIDFQFPTFHVVRYFWSMKPNIYSITTTILKGAYFSHLSAMYLNGLLDYTPKDIYINAEQIQRPPNLQKLTQNGIDKAFMSHPRITANSATFEDYRINILNGKQTGNLGVLISEIKGIGTISLTNIERTLIDIAVRPVYSGGAYEVLKAYKAPTGLASIAKIVEYLEKINHVYPYHQNIGFYLERSGFPEESVSMLHRIKREFTFYLDYRIENPKFSEKWNLFYPGSFDSIGRQTKSTD